MESTKNGLSKFWLHTLIDGRGNGKIFGPTFSAQLCLYLGTKRSYDFVGGLDGHRNDNAGVGWRLFCEHRVAQTVDRPTASDERSNG